MGEDDDVWLKLCSKGCWLGSKFGVGTHCGSRTPDGDGWHASVSRGGGVSRLRKINEIVLPMGIVLGFDIRILRRGPVKCSLG